MKIFHNKIFIIVFFLNILCCFIAKTDFDKKLHVNKTNLHTVEDADGEEELIILMHLII